MCTPKLVEKYEVICTHWCRYSQWRKTFNSRTPRITSWKNHHPWNLSSEPSKRKMTLNGLSAVLHITASGTRFLAILEKSSHRLLTMCTLILTIFDDRILSAVMVRVKRSSDTFDDFFIRNASSYEMLMSARSKPCLNAKKLVAGNTHVHNKATRAPNILRSRSETMAL